MKCRGLTLIEVLIVVSIVAIILALIITMVRGDGRDDRCRELCDALRHRTIKATQDACVCEDPETGKRQAHPFRGSSSVYYGNQGVLVGD